MQSNLTDQKSIDLSGINCHEIAFLVTNLIRILLTIIKFDSTESKQ